MFFPPLSAFSDSFGKRVEISCHGVFKVYALIVLEAIFIRPVVVGLFHCNRNQFVLALAREGNLLQHKGIAHRSKDRRVARPQEATGNRKLPEHFCPVSSLKLCMYAAFVSLRPGFYRLCVQGGRLLSSEHGAHHFHAKCAQSDSWLSVLILRKENVIGQILSAMVSGQIAQRLTSQPRFPDLAND